MEKTHILKICDRMVVLFNQGIYRNKVLLQYLTLEQNHYHPTLKNIYQIYLQMHL